MRTEQSARPKRSQRPGSLPGGSPAAPRWQAGTFTNRKSFRTRIHSNLPSAGSFQVSSFWLLSGRAGKNRPPNRCDNGGPPPCFGSRCFGSGCFGSCCSDPHTSDPNCSDSRRNNVLRAGAKGCKPLLGPVFLLAGRQRRKRRLAVCRIMAGTSSLPRFFKVRSRRLRTSFAERGAHATVKSCGGFPTCRSSRRSQPQADRH